MNKLKMHSLNKVNENIEKIGSLFPNCLTERKGESGEVEYAIDFDMLRQELSSVVVEGNEERYQFTWPDKKHSVLLANAPIAKTLRPCREESVDFDSTENLYIEGDNLDVLKLLQETYLGKVKMIYIDPPYNTGKDSFVYDDNFDMSQSEFSEASGQYDDDGNILYDLRVNNEANGKFHTDWLNMIYPRLKLAKDLLADDGVIFISIDDNEVAQLRKICDEVFGAGNFVAQLIWQQRKGGGNDSRLIAVDHEYIVVYTKQNLLNVKWRVKHSDEYLKRYKEVDEIGRFYWDTLSRDGLQNPIPVTITAPDGQIVSIKSQRSQKSVEEGLQDGSIRLAQTSNGWSLHRKVYIPDGQVLRSLLLNVGNNRNAGDELKVLFNDIYFDYAKPVGLLKTVCSLCASDCDIILDFFSGSATTAHAVMQLNAEDGGNRKFIMVQLPEETNEKSEAYRAGFENICEIGKERIRRAGAKIQAKNDMLKDVPLLETEQDMQLFVDVSQHGKDAIERTKSAFNRADFSQSIDTGFRVLKLDSTNMKDVYYSPAEYKTDLFRSLTNNIKEDRTPEDLLFQIMLDLGVLLSGKIEESTIADKKVFNVADGFLIACFDENVTEETIQAIAQKKPYYFVMRDSSMANDSVAANFEQIFAAYSPDTVRKVL